MDELNKAHINFEYAEYELIDFYSYQIIVYGLRDIEI